MLYPNPVSSQNLLVSYTSKEIGEIKFRVYNSSGQVLKAQVAVAGIGEETFSLDVAALPKGNYILEVISKEKRGMAKFVIQ